MRITIGNIRNGDTGEYIGRACQGRAGSPLANPFFINKDGDRQEVVTKYASWLWSKVQSGDTDVLAEGQRLLKLAHRPGGVCLLCWCMPLPCHGEIIRKWLLWMEKGEPR